MNLKECYAAAEKLMPWQAERLVLNGNPMVRKVDDSHFFYRYDLDQEHWEFRKVNTDTLEESELFDHALLCRLLAAESLPFDACEVQDGKIVFMYQNRRYVFDGLTLEEKEMADLSVSPDGRYGVYVNEHDLYLKDVETGETTRLTDDGQEHFAYGKCAEYSGYITKPDPSPEVLWSPDSTHFLTVKLDERKVKELYLLKTYDEPDRDSIRPQLISYRCAFPEDEHIPLASYYLCDVREKKMVKADMPAQPCGGRLLGNRFAGAKWMADSSCVFTTWVSRGHKSASFIIINIDGHTETVVEEEADTFLNIRSYGGLDGYGSYGASNFLSKDQRKVIWQSEKDGYARLYAYDVKTKKELYPITPEEVIVGELLAEDEESVYFYAGNPEGMSDPCLRALCRVRLDGEGFRVLTPEDAMHACVMVNDLIIDTYSRADLAPVTVVRKKDGTFLKELVKADITALLEAGYVMPERFAVKAADGVTDLYGILIRPKDFDETKLYPFVEYIYGGMQCYNVPRRFEWMSSLPGREMLGGLEAFAQVGMAGIILDGRGTPGRGKAFHEFSWKNIHGCAGLADHVYALKELKQKYPFLDPERAGIWGNSGGGYASTRAMLEYPGVYKAAVSSAGNHDQRMYNENWTENYYGPYDRELYRKGDNTALAENLEGHLLIVHGMMDDNVAMAQSARLVDALVQPDKDFDFLLLPRVNHNVPADPYFIRKKLDYFVRYLLEETPPDFHFQNSR